MNRFKPHDVFLISETKLVDQGLDQYLNFLGVPSWSTDAASDAETLMEVAGKTCYMSFSTDLNKNLTRVGTRTNEQYLQEGIIATRHGSVLEHAYVTFAFCNVSRVLTHELIRHRTGCSYSQVSGRYVRSDKIDSADLPLIIKHDPVAMGIFNRGFRQMEENIKELSDHFKIDEMKTQKEFSIKKILTSAFRRLIGNGQANHIIFTANHRALRHILVERTSVHAEEEIRLAFIDVFEILSERYPAVYADMFLHYPTKEEKANLPECQWGIPEVRCQGYNKV